MWKYVILLPLLLSLSGCVTMLHGTSQKIEFTSEPPGAEINFRDLSCTTPCILEAARSSRPAMLRITLAGREGYIGELNSHDVTVGDSPGLLVPTVVSGLLIVPAFVDLSSNTLYEWPQSIHAVLPPEKQGSVRLEVKRKPN